MDIEIIIIVLFPVFFIAMWGGVLLLLANLGGWSRLAQHYQTRSDFAGHRWSFRSGRLGLTNYSGCLTIGSNGSGLYLAVFSLFRVGHPPLFIPWEDIKTAPSRSFFVATLSFTFARAPTVTLKLPEKLGNTILSFRPEIYSGER